jgi:hypothetical protein
MKNALEKLCIIPLTVLVAGPAFAQDRCADILRDGTIQLGNYSENSYVRQILIRRFLNSSFETSKTDMSASATVPVGEIIMGGKYSSSDYNRKKRLLQSYFSSDMTETREIDVAISSGDETIVGAWSECMKKHNQPLLVRIEQQGAKRAEVTIEYAGGGGSGSTRLLRDVKLPTGITIESGGEHFRRGARFVARTPRKIVLRMSNAITPVSVNVSTNAGDAVAYLPPRLKFSRLNRPLAIEKLRTAKRKDNVDAVRTYTLYGVGSNAGNINLTATSFGGGSEAEGWFFDTSVPFTPKLITRRSYYCERLKHSVQPSFISYSYRLRAGDKNATTICEVSGVVMLVNEVWRAQDDDTPGEIDPLVAEPTVTVPSSNPDDEKILSSPALKFSYNL